MNGIRSLSVDEWFKNMPYIHKGVLFSYEGLKYQGKNPARP
jgi:hypothetical protein